VSFLVLLFCSFCSLIRRVSSLELSNKALLYLLLLHLQDTIEYHNQILIRSCEHLFHIQFNFSNPSYFFLIFLNDLILFLLSLSYVSFLSTIFKNKNKTHFSYSSHRFSSHFTLTPAFIIFPLQSYRFLSSFLKNSFITLIGHSQHYARHAQENDRTAEAIKLYNLAEDYATVVACLAQALGNTVGLASLDEKAKAIEKTETLRERE
jgi:hypothetical protein